MLKELNYSLTLLQSYLTWLLSRSAGELAVYFLLTFFALLVAFEFARPRKKWPAKPLLQSYRANAGLFMFNSVSMSLLSMPSLLALAGQYAGKGLLSHIADPVTRALLAFLAIDLLLYALHQACHRFDCLWMFHKVHHNDAQLNVSTAFRIHFLEIVLIGLLKAATIVVLGIDAGLLLANETLIVLFTMFHHANISFPGEQWLGRLLITPYLHRVHHSTLRCEHDRNYGAVLSVWDRLFGTLAELEPAAVGVDGSTERDLLGLIRCGLTRQQQSGTAKRTAERQGFRWASKRWDWLETEN